MISKNKEMDELYFFVRNYYDFKEEFKKSLSSPFPSNFTVFLVDSYFIESWKQKIHYTEIESFLKNHDYLSFSLKEKDLIENLQTSTYIDDIYSFDSFEEFLSSLKEGRKFEIISYALFSYITRNTYPNKPTQCYCKSQQIILHFGQSNSILIKVPQSYFVNDDFDIKTRNVYAFHLPEKRNVFLKSLTGPMNFFETISCKDFEGEVTRVKDFFKRQDLFNTFLYNTKQGGNVYYDDYFPNNNLEKENDKEIEAEYDFVRKTNFVNNNEESKGLKISNSQGIKENIIHPEPKEDNEEEAEEEEGNVNVEEKGEGEEKAEPEPQPEGEEGEGEVEQEGGEENQPLEEKKEEEPKVDENKEAKVEIQVEIKEEKIEEEGKN